MLYGTVGTMEGIWSPTARGLGFPAVESQTAAA